MKLEQGKFCPLIGKDCIGINCSWFTQVRGTNPNTGQEVDEWGCAVTWMPTLLIENSNQQRGTAASIQSFRNEVVRANHFNQQLFVQGLGHTANQLPPTPINILPESES